MDRGLRKAQKVDCGTSAMGSGSHHLVVLKVTCYPMGDEMVDAMWGRKGYPMADPMGDPMDDTKADPWGF
jgi:hypothetical protein